MRTRPVEVHLVGAGPGDPGLFTVAGAQLVARADIIVYDYLANPALLEGAKASAERIYVGKKGFSQHVTQDEINALLVEKARELASRGGGTLVRLKGGDPFVFGRGGEEALALAEAGVACSIVPGVTSGVAAPAFAGIPVTHRGLASSVAFITGNEDPTKAETAIDWEGIARGADTLCFYMGVRNLPIIAERLIEAGRAPGTPVALVRWGTLPEQEVLEGTLADIAERAQRAGFQAPAIIVVGKVAALRERLAWFEPGPLAGMTIAVTRTRAQASDAARRLRALGASVLELPTIDIAPPPSFAETDAAIARLAGYRFVVFTSANGVKGFFARLEQAGLDARALACARVAAIGPATADELAARGIRADLVPDEYRAEAVAEQLFEAGVAEGDWVLVPRALEARDVLPRMLKARGVRVDVAPVYRTVPPARRSVEQGLARIVAGEVDAVTFTSSSTARNFAALMREHAGGEFAPPCGLSFFSIGPITSDTARELGFPIAAQASEYTVAGLVDAIVEHRAKRAEGK
ncbi:uroporphyrinogen-III C-methyltransferase [Arabiibacter massiliensis]|uniref:uroporphyrinogen-III C-methyltransferase n=1 Tax=Arabiibacter massiliensis TaxID=1870985 RepID=UPI0009BBC715|nr:uroporphyrinogen-III C-methyltransferase [Arabiibacter massiliensis]